MATWLVENLTWINDVVSYVWIALTLLMIGSLYLLHKKDHREFWLIVILLIATWLYPLYSLNFAVVAGTVGTALYTVLLVYVLYRVYRMEKWAAALLVPTLIWVAIALSYGIAQIALLT